jgi:hypothetical protein
MSDRVPFLTEDDELVVLDGRTYVANFFGPHGRVRAVYVYDPERGRGTRMYYSVEDAVARLAVAQRKARA